MTDIPDNQKFEEEIKEYIRAILGEREYYPDVDLPGSDLYEIMQICRDYLTGGHYMEDDWTVLAVEAHVQGLLDYTEEFKGFPDRIAKEGLIMDRLSRERELEYLKDRVSSSGNPDALHRMAELRGMKAKTRVHPMERVDLDVQIH